MKEHPSFLTYGATIVTALGPFLFGYNTAVISGALLFIAREFALNPAQEGFLVSIILLGALLGASFAGAIADRYGRRRAMLATAVIYCIGIGICSISSSFHILCWGRFVAGIGVGLSSLIPPLYLAEITPPHFRGRFVSVNQLSVTIGILVAYLINQYFAAAGEWRLMLGVALFPAGVQLLLLFFVPESPRWLLAHGREEESLKALRRLRRDREWQEHLPEMETCSAHRKEIGWKKLLQPHVFFMLVIGVLLSIFQQITGINTVIYFAPKIFESAGFNSLDTALWATLGIGIVNVLATILSICLIDRVGRKPLLFWGIGGMVVSLFLLAAGLYYEVEIIDLIASLSLMAYVFFFAIGLGPMVAVILSEVYPQHIRGRAMSIAMAANWIANYFVSLTFLNLLQGIGSAMTFCLYAAMGVIAFWFTKRFIPETKGKSLEEIEKSL